MRAKTSFSRIYGPKVMRWGQREEEREQKPREREGEGALKVSREGVLNARKRRREDDYQSRCKHGARGREDGKCLYSI